METRTNHQYDGFYQIPLMLLQPFTLSARGSTLDVQIFLMVVGP